MLWCHPGRWGWRIPSPWIFHFPASPCPTPSDKSQDFLRLSQTTSRCGEWLGAGADYYCFGGAALESSFCEIPNWVEQTIISLATAFCPVMRARSYSPISAAIYNRAQNLALISWMHGIETSFAECTCEDFVTQFWECHNWTRGGIEIYAAHSGQLWLGGWLKRGRKVSGVAHAAGIIGRMRNGCTFKI